MEAPAERLNGTAATIFRRLSAKAPPQFFVSFYPYVSTKSTIRQRPEGIKIRISDHLAGAPDQVIAGVLALLLTRLLRVAPPDDLVPQIDAYQEYVHDERISKRRGASRRTRGRKHLQPQGEWRDLLASYLRVTMDLAVTPPVAPKLGWSQTVSRRRFGHWDKDHEAIIISRALDDERVPEFVLDYVMYHEILHIVIPPQRGSGNKLIVHSQQFKAAEARFPKQAEAERWLQTLANKKGK